MFVSGVVQSLVASVLFSIYQTKRKTASKDNFEQRAKMFHKKIVPYVFNELLPELSPSIVNKLYKISTKEGEFILPFYEPFPDQQIQITESLQTSKYKFNVDKNLINWLIHELGKKITNNPTFIITGIDSNGKLAIGIGDYFSTISTSDKHYFNMVRYFPLTDNFISRFVYKNSLHMKKWVKSLSSVTLENHFTHYCASIGCSVLTVMKCSDGKYKYLIKANSKSKGSAVHDKHVIPSFMFQPIASRIYEQERELDLKLSILREYGEELLGVKELESAGSVDALWEHVRKNKLLRNLEEKIDLGEAILEMTGFVVDAFRLRPEITFLLLIHEEKYCKKIQLNWETENILDYVEVDDEKAFTQFIADTDSPLCAPGLAALINGRPRALELLNNR